MSLRYSHVNCHFYLDGKEFAMRSYFVAPAKGDEIALGPENNRTYYKVVRRVFGNEHSTQSYFQRINIEIEEIVEKINEGK